MAKDNKNEKPKKMICTGCGNEKRLEDFYSSSSFFHKFTGKTHVCKKCISDYVETNDVNDINTVKNFLRMIDKPFLIDLYESSLNESKKTNKTFLGLYMKNVVFNFKEYTWADSSFDSNEILSEDSEEQPINIKDEMIIKWGRGYSSTDIEYLENFYSDYENSYATDTPAQVNLYKNIAKVHLQAEKELANGQTKTFKDLMELSSKMHNDGNIKPIQSTGANDDKGLSAYGLWIKTIEQDEPCEYFKDKPTYEDFDGFKKYIEKWFVRPFKNIFNISKDFDVKDED